MNPIATSSVLVRTLLLSGAIALVASAGAAWYLTKSAPKTVGAKLRHGPPENAQIAAGSLDYWIGTWDARVLASPEYPDLPPADREALEWSREVLARALGGWIATPDSRHDAVQSPLKLFTPAENDRARRYGEAWIDLAGNEWRPTDRQQTNQFWIETAVRFRGREVLLAMSFEDVPSDPTSFEYYYRISLDNGESWLVGSTATFSRAGLLVRY